MTDRIFHEPALGDCREALKAATITVAEAVADIFDDVDIDPVPLLASYGTMLLSEVARELEEADSTLSANLTGRDCIRRIERRAFDILDFPSEIKNDKKLMEAEVEAGDAAQE